MRVVTFCFYTFEVREVGVYELKLYHWKNFLQTVTLFPDVLLGFCLHFYSKTLFTMVSVKIQSKLKLGLQNISSGAMAVFTNFPED